MEEIAKMKIKNAFVELMRFQGSDKVYHKSVPKITVFSGKKYFGFFDGCAKGNPGPAGAGYNVLNSQG